MKLLIVTQVVDANDPILGFFVRWVEEFAKHTDRVEVICLKEGTHALPANVRVHSLGKECGARSRLAYALRLLVLVWRLRGNYDVVFVHMNQEYVLIAGWLWKLMGKRIYLWRNHYAGSQLTDVAALFCRSIFCTSQDSYTARYKKTILMPVGVDTERFFPDAHTVRIPRSILFFGRVSPSKRPEMLIDALALLKDTLPAFTASFYGSPLPEDTLYYEGLREKVRALGLADAVSFSPAVRHDQAPKLYRAHEIFVNASPSGMFDKTLFEAAACGCVVFSASADIQRELGKQHAFEDAVGLAKRLEEYLASPQDERGARSYALGSLVGRNSLDSLADALIKHLSV